MFTIRDDQYSEMRKQVFIENLLEVFSNEKQKATYDNETNNILITDIKGNTTRVGFDSNGFIGYIKSPLGRTWRFANNNDGNLLGIRNPANSILKYDYNSDGDIEQISRDGNIQYYFEYITKGYPDTITFPDNTYTRFKYNESLKTTEIRDRRGKTQKYQYDDNDNLITIEDEKANLTQFDYSYWNRPDTVHYADGSTESYGYNSQGLLENIAVESKIVAQIKYNNKNQQTERYYSDGKNLFFNYDNNGHIISAKNEEAIFNYFYDNEGRLLEEKQGEQSVKYQYNELGNIKGLVYPSGETVKFEYDADFRLTSITDWKGKKYRFEYLEDKKEECLYLSNNLTIKTKKNINSLPKQIQTIERKTQKIIFQQNYTFDDFDRVKIFEDLEFGRKKYQYDEESQLLSVKSKKSGTERFKYDAAKNRISWNGIQATYNNLNQLTQQGDIECKYDEYGNMLEMKMSTEKWRYTFNKQNLLIRAESSNGKILSFFYDAFGRRVRKRCGLKEVLFFWMGENLIAENVFKNGKIVDRKEYLYKPGTYTPLAIRINNDVYWYHTDHLGTPIRLTNFLGQTVWSSDYSGFGIALVEKNAIGNALRFPGQYWDDEIGLYYNRFRYYSPVLGRYISRDPVSYLAGLNFYIYVDNNPINCSDPLGLWWKAALSIVAGVAAAVAVIAFAPITGPLLIVAAGAAAGAVGAGVNEILNNGFCFECILNAILKGMIVGGLASLPFLFLPAAGSVGALAFVGASTIAGASSGAISYTTNHILTNGFTSKNWNWNDFFLSVSGGGVMGAIGGIISISGGSPPLTMPKPVLSPSGVISIEQVVVVPGILASQASKLGLGIALSSASSSAVSSSGGGSGNDSNNNENEDENEKNINDVKLGENFEKHIKERDLNVPRKRGIGGAHNADEFMKEAIKENVIIETRKPHPTVDGVEIIEYKIPKLDRTGAPTGEYKSITYTKTIYDPKKISDSQMIKWVKEAAQNAKNKGMLSREWVAETNNGIKIRGYLNEKDEIISAFIEH